MVLEWLRPDVKKALDIHWETDEGFMRRHLTNRAKRASVRSSKYTGGSTTFMKTKASLSKTLDRDATMKETFKYTHTLKENNERFADQRSANHYNISEPYKNPDYELGLFFANNLRISTLRASSTFTSSPVNPEDSIDLRDQVQNLTQSLHQQAQQLQQSEERYNEILARMSDTNSLKLVLRQKLEQIQQML
ncbi:hypothetical protein Ahy_B02g060325 [Arachis hypogaea]|uniref:Uncharacterized protein n=1 Tax=Arachis hypogaea TaxID=3818 RepID=A0A445AIA7_ARAHY|nr:hypothetical protein Ahy_B02g060325 [Arachis hypogaea]